MFLNGHLTKHKVRFRHAKLCKIFLNYLTENNLSTLHADTQDNEFKPGYQFHVVNGIITNFHQPKSTLLLLVSAFVNGNWTKVTITH